MIRWMAGYAQCDTVLQSENEWKRPSPTQEQITRSPIINRRTIKAATVAQACACLIALSVMGTSCAYANDGSLAHDAKKAGSAAGSAAHGIGQEAKKAGIAIGHEGKKVGLTIGHAAKAGGLAFWHAVKGEHH